MTPFTCPNAGTSSKYRKGACALPPSEKGRPAWVEAGSPWGLSVMIRKSLCGWPLTNIAPPIGYRVSQPAQDGARRWPCGAAISSLQSVQRQVQRQHVHHRLTQHAQGATLDMRINQRAHLIH